MRKFDLGKLRFNFAGDYNAAKLYETNDVVRYGGNLYVWISPTKLTGILPTDPTGWGLMVAGMKYVGAYVPAQAYRIGEVIRYGASVFVCALDTTGNAPPNATYWTLLSESTQTAGAYSNIVPYQKNSIVFWGASAYIAKQDTLAHLPSDTTYWDSFVQGMRNLGVYSTLTDYFKGDLVTYGASLFVAKQATTGHTPTSVTYWDLLVSGVRYRGQWASGQAYLINDIVTSGSSSFIALVDVQNAVDPAGDVVNWKAVMAGSNAQVAKSGDTMTGPLVVQSTVTANGVTSTTVAATGQMSAASLLVSGLSSIQGVLEAAKIAAASANGVMPVNAIGGTVNYWTSSASANWTFNLRGDATNSLNSLMAVGQSISFAVLVTLGGTGYVASGIQIDGAAQSVKWQSGAAPTALNPNSIDSYTITAIKTADAVFTVLATRTKYA